MLTVGLVGDRSDAVIAHRAIPLALTMAARDAGAAVDHEWLPTESITSIERLANFAGLWCVPGSPYRSMEGALLAIRHARERRLPFLGTCGGFQHAVIEYARDVLNWRDADHAESAPEAERAVISPLGCGLLDDLGSLRLLEGTALAQAYGTPHVEEEYRCRFGVNPAFRSKLVSGPLRESAVDQSGDLRAVELSDHPFFIGTLFQPERAALRGKTPPLVAAFLRACAAATLRTPDRMRRQS